MAKESKVYKRESKVSNHTEKKNSKWTKDLNVKFETTKYMKKT